MESQIVLGPASWLGVAQRLRGHLQHKVCHSVTVCWSAAPAVRREFILSWLVCLKGSFGCQRRLSSSAWAPVSSASDPGHDSASSSCSSRPWVRPVSRAIVLLLQKRRCRARTLSCTSDSESLDGTETYPVEKYFPECKSPKVGPFSPSSRPLCEDLKVQIVNTIT